jgi:hypothetical protein
MSETQAAQIATLRAEFKALKEDFDTQEKRLAELEENDKKYDRIIGSARFAGILILGAGALVPWLVERVEEFRRFFTVR